MTAIGGGPATRSFHRSLCKKKAGRLIVLPARWRGEKGYPSIPNELFTFSEFR